MIINCFKKKKKKWLLINYIHLLAHTSPRWRDWRGYKITVMSLLFRQWRSTHPQITSLFNHKNITYTYKPLVSIILSILFTFFSSTHNGVNHKSSPVYIKLSSLSLSLSGLNTFSLYNWILRRICRRLRDIFAGALGRSVCWSDRWFGLVESC